MFSFNVLWCLRFSINEGIQLPLNQLPYPLNLMHSRAPRIRCSFYAPCLLFIEEL